MVRVSLDTSVLVYAEGFGDAVRCRRARELVGSLPVSALVVPVQCLGELHRVLTGTMGRTPRSAQQAILDWTETARTADTTHTAMMAATQLACDHSVSWWDALILAVSAEARCRVLLSEDFQHGFLWQGTVILSPFRDETVQSLQELLDV